MMTAPKPRRSPKAPVYENLRVEKSLNPNEIKARPLERKVSNSNDKNRRTSNAAKSTIERKTSNPKPGVERKASNSRDLGKAVVNNPKGNRTKVKRNKSTQV